MPRLRTAPTKPAPLIPPTGEGSTLHEGMVIKYRLPASLSPLKRFFFVPVCSPTWRFWHGCKLIWVASRTFPMWLRVGVMIRHIFVQRLITWDVK